MTKSEDLMKTARIVQAVRDLTIANPEKTAFTTSEIRAAMHADVTEEAKGIAIQLERLRSKNAR